MCRERELDELGFVWDPEEAAWAARLQAVDGLLERLGPQVGLYLTAACARSQLTNQLLALQPSILCIVSVNNYYCVSSSLVLVRSAVM